MKKYLMMIIFIFFFQCGLPDSDALNQMNPPMNLKAAAKCSGTTFLGVEITFWGFNSESFFSGYNIYMVKKADLWTYDVAKVDVGNHILPSGQTRTFNTDLENQKILKNDANGLPTIPMNELMSIAPGFSSKPVKITKTFNKTPILSVDDYGGPFSPGSGYYFVATAIALSTRVETVPSNVYPDSIGIMVIPAIPCP